MAPSVQDILHRRVTCFSGRVQGVGFRYTVKNIAMQYDVRGYVRNLPDGRVELLVEGRQADLDEIGAAICQRMGGFIRSTQSVESPATNEFQQFSIRH